jgi:hypothetical protein
LTQAQEIKFVVVINNPRECDLRASVRLLYVIIVNTFQNKVVKYFDHMGQRVDHTNGVRFK